VGVIKALAFSNKLVGLHILRYVTACVLLCLYREHLVALHGFIKKTRTTPDDDLALARKR